MDTNITQLDKRAEKVAKLLCERLGYSFTESPEHKPGWTIKDKEGSHYLANHKELNKYLTDFLINLDEKGLYSIILSNIR